MTSGDPEYTRSVPCHSGMPALALLIRRMSGSAARIGRRFGRTPSTIRRIVDRRRGQALRRLEITWVDLPTFELADAEDYKTSKALAEEQDEAFREALAGYLSKRWRGPKQKRRGKYDLAILHNPDEHMPPSNAKALDRFLRAARRQGLDAELITPRDFGRLGEFAVPEQGVDYECFRVDDEAEQQGHDQEGENGRTDQPADHDRSQTAVEFAAGAGKEHQGQHAEHAGHGDGDQFVPYADAP